VILTKVGGGDLNAMPSTGKQHESAKTHTLAARDANAVLGHSFPPQMLSQGQLSYWVGRVLLRNAAFTLGFHWAFAPVSIRQYVFQRHICVLGLSHDAIFRHLTFAWRFHEKSGNEHLLVAIQQAIVNLGTIEDIPRVSE